MSSISLAVLLKIYPKESAIPLLYQNYRPSAPIMFLGESYTFAGFEIQNYPTLDLAQGGGDMMIAIRRSALLDSILLANNDLKQAIGSAYHIQPGMNIPPYLVKFVVSFATREGGLVLFTVRSATSALQGSLTSKYFERKDFPELPYYRARF